MSFDFFLFTSGGFRVFVSYGYRILPDGTKILCMSFDRFRLESSDFKFCFELVLVSSKRSTPSFFPELTLVNKTRRGILDFSIPTTWP